MGEGKRDPMVEKLKENRLRWFELVQCRPLSAPHPLGSDSINLNQARDGGRPKLKWTCLHRDRYGGI